jgi:hypothetical protein
MTLVTVAAAVGFDVVTTCRRRRSGATLCVVIVGDEARFGIIQVESNECGQCVREHARFIRYLQLRLGVTAASTSTARALPARTALCAPAEHGRSPSSSEAASTFLPKSSGSGDAPTIREVRDGCCERSDVSSKHTLFESERRVERVPRANSGRSTEVTTAITSTGVVTVVVVVAAISITVIAVTVAHHNILTAGMFHDGLDRCAIAASKRDRAQPIEHATRLSPGGRKAPDGSKGPVARSRCRRKVNQKRANVGAAQRGGKRLCRHGQMHSLRCCLAVVIFAPHPGAGGTPLTRSIGDDVYGDRSNGSGEAVTLGAKCARRKVLSEHNGLLVDILAIVRRRDGV